MRMAFVVARLAVTTAIVAAVVAQLHSSLAYISGNIPGAARNVTVNFFSYFTVDGTCSARSPCWPGRCSSCVRGGRNRAGSPWSGCR